MDANQQKQVSLFAMLEAFTMPGAAMEIEQSFGLQILASFIADITAVQSGVPFSEFGYSERRKQSAPAFILQNAASNTLVSKWDIKDGLVPRNSIGVLKLHGFMQSNDGLCSYGATSFASNLREMYDNPNVKGVLIDVQSGGGQAMAGSIIQNAVSEKNKPVVAFGPLMASAAYRAVAGVNEIIAMGSAAEFGSIGTMVSIDSKSLSQYRQRYMDIYATTSGNKNEEFRAMDSGNIAVLQARLDRVNEVFQNEIRQYRPLRGSAAKIEETLSGRMFDAEQAKQRGLIDMVGTFSTAIARINALAK